MRRVLCISGKRFSGKDTFAALLQQHAHFETYAFAGESKRMFVEVQRAAGVDVDLARLQGDRTYKELWRPRLTQLTVNALAADPLVFCRAVADRIAASTRLALITDLRLRLELDHLRTRFAPYVIRIQRSDAARAASGWRYDAATDEHHTETELDDPALWDRLVTNDGTLEALSSVAAEISAR